jgi:shikimate dehydrogenase
VQRLPVIGQSFTHSAFEAVQQAALAAAGLPIRIERWDRKPHQLAAAIDELRSDEFAGALIAQPHKEKAAGLVPSLSDDARHAGAVNVVVQDGGRLRGHNTDVDGLRAGIEALLADANGAWPRHAVVLGAGGGARAAVSVLIAGEMQRIAVFNRHLYRAESLVAHFARGARTIDLRAMPWHETILEAELSKAGLLVNASGIGVEEGDEAIPAALLPERLFLLDLVLDRPSTPLMAEVQARGGAAANGQASFLASSAATFRLLTGQAAGVEVMRTALADALAEASAEALGEPQGAALVGD